MGKSRSLWTLGRVATVAPCDYAKSLPSKLNEQNNHMTTTSGRIPLENADALVDLGAILTHIGALVKKLTTGVSVL